MSRNLSTGWRYRPLLCVSLLAALSTPFAASVTLANPQLMSEVDAQAATEVSYANFQQWLQEFRQYAANQGISEATLSSALDGVRFRERVIELDGYQPEFVRPIWEYLDTAVSSTRINTGRETFAAHRDTALEMQQRFGVPAEIIVAIWGIESNYGSNFGDFLNLRVSRHAGL